MLATTLAADPFLGRLLTGRIESGHGRAPARPSRRSPATGARSSASASRKILAFRGLARTPIESAEAGDIVSLAGMAKATVADTLADLAVTEALPAQPIDPPTISVTFGINDSPLAGRDGDKVQTRVIRERLHARGRVERGDPGQPTPPAATPSRSPAAASCRWAC